MKITFWMRLASWLLRWTERFYLNAHGWDRLQGEDYVPPADYEFRKHDRYHRRHAVNAQHQVYARGHLHVPGKLEQEVRELAAKAQRVDWGAPVPTVYVPPEFNVPIKTQEDQLMDQLQASMKQRQAIPKVKP